MIADKGFAGEFERLMAKLGAIFLRPDRKGEPPLRRSGRHPSMGRIDHRHDQRPGFSLEHGAHTMPGLISRIAQRLLALAAGSGTAGTSVTPPHRIRPLTHPPQPESVI